MLKKTLALVGLTLSLSANASIVDLGVITRDTGTGLDWLDLTETHWQSYDTVTERLQEGGDLEGWNYATSAQLDTLLTNFGGTPNLGCGAGVSYCGHSTENNGLVAIVLAHLGDLSGDGTLISSGILADTHETTHGGTWQRIAHLSDSAFLDPATAATHDYILNIPGTSINPGIEYGDAGSFLVRASAVPVPAAAWLFGSAVIGLAGIKRKKYL
jgi:hypothetical protein